MENESLINDLLSEKMGNLTKGKQQAATKVMQIIMEIESFSKTTGIRDIEWKCFSVLGSESFDIVNVTQKQHTVCTIVDRNEWDLMFDICDMVFVSLNKHQFTNLINLINEVTSYLNN